MANTKTAVRWTANGWYFKTIEVAEDPDFPGEYTLPHYIKNHPGCGLLPIRKRIGYNFQKSVKTKYFNY